MKSANVKRSISIRSRKTGISLEDDFWNSLREIARSRDEPVSQLIARIDKERKFANLSSAIRVFVLGYYQDQYNSSKRVDPAFEDLDPSPDHFDLRTN